MNTSNPHPSFSQYPKKNVKNCKLSPTHKPIIPLHFSIPTTPRKTKIKELEFVNPSMLHLIPICFLHISESVCVCVCAHALSHVWLFMTPWTVACQAPWNFPGKNTGEKCHFLLQGIFLTQGLNPSCLCLLHWQADSLPLPYLGSPWTVSNICLSTPEVSDRLRWSKYNFLLSCGICLTTGYSWFTCTKRHSNQKRGLQNIQRQSREEKPSAKRVLNSTAIHKTRTSLEKKRKIKSFRTIPVIS